MFDRCTNIWTFLAIFCTCYFLQTTVHTYLTSSIQSIERQFQIPSKMSGTLASAREIGYVSTIVILAYFGGKGNRARWISAGILIISAACLLISMPYFLFPHQQDVTLDDDALFANISEADWNLEKRLMQGKNVAISKEVKKFNQKVAKINLKSLFPLI